MNYNIVDNNLYDNYDYLENVIKRTLIHEKVENPLFSIIFVNEEEIQAINLKYRNIDRVTDVISFALEDAKDFELSNIRVLGDIYICIPRMKEQSIAYNHSEKRELSFLCVHGLLHLLGYDHQILSEEKIMFDIQEEILDAENIKR